MNKFSDIVSELIPSPDCRAKSTEPWVGIIVHHTTVGANFYQLNAEQKNTIGKNIAGWLSKKDDNYVSAHFQINYDGKIIQLVDPRVNVAYHAGVSSYYHPIKRKWVKGWNEYAVGIELLGDGNRAEFTKEQYASLALLSNELIKQFKTIDPRCVTGHENIAPDRKIDPGALFKWRNFFASLKWEA